MFIFLNPAFLYISIWSLVFALYLLNLSDYLIELKPIYTLYIISTFLSFLFGWFIACLLYGKIFLCRKINNNKYLTFALYNHKKYFIKIIYLVIFLYVISVLYSGNIPLLFMIGYGSEVNYAAFGVPVLLGLTNAMLMTAYLMHAAFLLLSENKEKKLSLLFFFVVPLLLVNRQMFLSMLAQAFFLYLIIKGISVRSFFLITTMLVLSFFGFGFAGDFRSGREGIIYLAQFNFDYPDWLNSSFAWVYVYLTSPINNLFNNIEIEPSYLPVSLLSNFLPSFFRDGIFDYFGIEISEWSLVVEILNVSSFHRPMLEDFGPWFGNCIYSLFSFLFTIVMIKSNNDPKCGLVLVVILHGLLFSFFASLLYHLVYIFQIFIILILFKSSSSVVKSNTAS